MDPQFAMDSDAVLDHGLSRKPLEPEVYRRVWNRLVRITDEIRRELGVLNIAEGPVRETRDEE
jgi:hypothetical protein